MKKNEYFGAIRGALVAGVVALVVAGSGLAAAGQESGPAGQPNERRGAIELVIRYLDLSDGQKEAWRGILQDTAEAIRPVAEQLRPNEQALRDLLQSTNPDAAAVGALVLQGKALRDQIAALEEAGTTALLATLTPEQAEKVDAVEAAAELCPLVPAFRAIHFF